MLVHHQVSSSSRTPSFPSRTRIANVIQRAISECFHVRVCYALTWLCLVFDHEFLPVRDPFQTQPRQHISFYLWTSSQPRKSANRTEADWFYMKFKKKCGFQPLACETSSDLVSKPGLRIDEKRIICVFPFTFYMLLISSNDDADTFLKIWTDDNFDTNDSTFKNAVSLYQETTLKNITFFKNLACSLALSTHWDRYSI